MMEGWVKIHRQISMNDLWTAEPFTRGQAWVDLILLASHKPGFIRVRGVRTELQRGDVGWSEVALSKRWRWSRGKARRFLKELKTEQQIVQRKSSITTVICIVNYDYYQSGGTADGQQTVQQTDSRRYSRRYPNKNEKNEKNEKKKTPIAPLKKYLEDKIIETGLQLHTDKIFEFYEYRMSRPKNDRYKTEKGINGLFRDIQGCLDAGLDVGGCLEITMEKEWKTPDPKYFVDKKKHENKHGFGQGVSKRESGNIKEIGKWLENTA